MFVRLVVAAVAMLVTVLLAPSAQAADKFGVITMELRVQQGGAPTHLCVVSQVKGPRTRTTLREVLRAVEPDSGAPASSWRIDPQAWGGDAATGDEHRCAPVEGGDCRPRLEIPPGLRRNGELHVACVADSLLESEIRSARPAFILLEHLEGSPPSIESVRLVGGVATVGVAADLERVIVTARSLGGYYLPHRVSERASGGARDAGTTGPHRKHVTLKLQARCRLSPVTLPGTRLSPRDRDRLSVRVHGIDFDVEKCVEGALDHPTVLQIRVPPAPLGVGSIEVELAATEAGKAAAKFGASYNHVWPPTPFPLTFKQVTFSWRRPRCIYPEASCPAAALETGTQCVATPTDEGCAYICPGEAGEDALDLQLPLTVHFEKEGPVQKWSDRLAQNGQLLTSYVDADDIYVGADISDWRTEEPANRITQIELFTEDGGTVPRGVTGIKKLQFKVPGASCEPLRFRPVGDREYADDIATIANGEIEFGKPERIARRLSFNMLVALGGGPAWSDVFRDTSNESPPIFFNGLGMFALRYRPRKRGWSRIGIEGRAGVTLGRWGDASTEIEATEEDTAPGRITDETTTTDATGTDEQRFAQARVFFEPGIVIAAHDRFAVGAGFGLGASFPIRAEQELTKERIQFIWTPNADARFYIQRWIGLVLQVRGVFGEQAFGVRTTPVAEDERAAKAQSLLVLFGAVLRF